MLQDGRPPIMAAVPLAEGPDQAEPVPRGALSRKRAGADGAEGYVSAKAVFMGTGGFGSNPDMVAALISGGGPIAHKVDEVLCHDGGISMMLGAGDAPSDLGLAHPSASSIEGVAWDTPADKAAREPYLWVSERGQHLGNEKWNVMMYKVDVKEPSHIYFNVIDSGAVARMETGGFKTNARTVLGSSDPVPETGAETEAAWTPASSTRTATTTASRAAARAARTSPADTGRSWPRSTSTRWHR